MLSRVFVHLGKADSAVLALKKADQSAQLLKDSVLIAEVQSAFGFYYKELGNYGLAREYYDTAIKAGTATKSNRGVKIVHGAKRELANTYYLTSNYEDYLGEIEQTIKYANANHIDDSKDQINKAIALYQVNKPLEALDIFLKYKTKLKKEGELFALNSIDHHIGFMLERIGLYEEALGYYHSVYDFYEQRNQTKNLLAVQSNIGEILIELDEYDEAKLLLEAVLNEKRNQNLKVHGFDYLNLGLVFLRTKDFSNAAKNFEWAMALYQKEGNMIKQGKTHNYLSELEIARGNYLEAKGHAQKGISIHEKGNRESDLADSYKNLSEAYQNLGQYKLAVEANVNFKNVSKNLNSPKELYAISQRMVKQKLNDSNPLSTNLENQDATGEQEPSGNEGNTLKLVVAVVVIVLLVVIVFFVKKPLITSSNAIYTLQKEEQELLSSSLTSVMNTKKPYLDKNLSLNQLAVLINTTDKKLSILLNRHLGTNFYDFINGFRIEEFINQMKNVDSKNYSIEGIALNSGFKSKSSFYRIFKKEMKMSPNEFKKSLD